jgi:putative transposase
VIDYVRTWADKAELPVSRLVGWIGIGRSKYHQWKQRHGQVNEHNAWVPRDHWLTDREKRAIVVYHFEHPLEGYRRLTYMMMDADVVAASPSSVYRVLRAGGPLGRSADSPSAKGTGFVQPLVPHEHWHIDVAYLNLCGTFYYLWLHSAIGYIAPADKLAGRAEAILAARDAKLAAAREACRQRRQRERIPA